MTARVLFILSHYPGFGGIEKVSDHIASYLCSEALSITFMSYGTNYPELIGNTPKPVELVFVPKPLDYESGENTSFIKDFLSENAFDFIILQDSFAPIEHIFSEIDYPWNERLIVVEHNTPLFAIKTVNSYFFEQKGILFFLKRVMLYPASVTKAYLTSRRRRLFLLKHCCRYVLLSEAFRKGFRLIAGNRYQEKITAINNPLTIAESDRDYFKSKKKQFLFVGRMSTQKGFDFLVRIWKEFSKCNPDNWELVLLVAGIRREELQSVIDRKRLENIRVEQPTSEIARYFEESSILAMTSIFEGFPLVLVEAMSRGCIPVAFDSFSSAKDIIKPGKSGLLVKPFDIKSYAKNLYRLANDEDLRRRMSEAAVVNTSNYGLSHIGAQWASLFDSILAEP